MNSNAEHILETVAGFSHIPDGAFNIRHNGKGVNMRSSVGISILPRKDGKGITVKIRPGTVGEIMHIPVVIDQSGIIDLVYNDFFIGEDCDVEIIAGCGIHNDGVHLTRHDGIHTFHIGKNSRVRYVEKHYGSGGNAAKVLNPVTNLFLAEGAHMEMDTVQIEGVDATKRVTKANLLADSTLVIKEKLLTSGKQTAATDYEINLNGKGAGVNLISRSVAKGESTQEFLSKINGNTECQGHSECDAIIMDNATVTAIPIVKANHVDASLIHEAAIGKIAGEQITKLLTLGLTQEEAEAEIVNGFLR